MTSMAWWLAKWSAARAWGGRHPEAVQWLAVGLVGLVLVFGWTWWHRSDAAEDAVQEAAEASRVLLDGIRIEMDGAERDVDAAEDDAVHECARSRGLFCDSLGRGP
jgi:hypothetical protein